MFRIDGRVAVITGGGSGIGRAIAHSLSDAGADIVLVGRREDALKDALGSRSGKTIPLDLMDDAAPAQLAKETKADILVNAAGINPRQPADTISAKDWQSTIHLNLSVPFLVAQALVPSMENWGRIINIASLQSSRAFKNGIAYGASKGGVSQLTRAMAEAWSARGITANAIAPGFFPTELTAAVFGDTETSDMHANQTAIGRNGELDDLAGPAVFLASEASRYVTGQILHVDGGYTAK